MPLEIALSEAADLAALERDWRGLETRAEASFFQSWSWIGTWLAVMPPARRPRILAVRRGSATVGLALFGQCFTRRHGFVLSRGLYLNETGHADLDGLTIEYNGVLADRSCASEVVAAVVAHAVGEVGGWDELYLSGVREGEYEDAVRRAGLSLHVINRSPCRFVDLDGLRARGVSYLDAVGKNTRYAIRRSKRRYEGRGSLTFDLARDARTALAYFDEMKSLHQAAWTARGEPGSFANPFFETFHRALIAACVLRGEVQLARIAAGPATVGVLYNFAWRGRVCNYQAGLAYESDNAIKPGLVSHELAIGHALAEGAGAYDFLAGDSDYKRSLSTDTAVLVWLGARKRRLKYVIEDSLRRAKNKLSSISPSAAKASREERAS